MTARSCMVLSDELEHIPWTKFQKMLYRLQYRIYKTAKKNDLNSVNKLQRLLIGSNCSRYIAIREVLKLYANNKSQFNHLGYPLKIDQIFKCISNLTTKKNWSYKENFISDNLLTSEIVNKIICILITYSLDPVREAQSFQNEYKSNYKFNILCLRNQISNSLKLKDNDTNFSLKVFKVDIKNCLDCIDFDRFISFFILPETMKKILISYLKLGILKERSFLLEAKLSNLLLDIVLSEILNIKQDQTFKNNFIKIGVRNSFKMILISDKLDCSKNFFKTLSTFFSFTGLNFKKLTFEVLDARLGFDFLGWHFKLKCKNKICVYFPSRKNRLNIIFIIKKTIKDVRYKLEERLLKSKLLYNKWLDDNHIRDSYRINLWFIKRWIHKYIKKNSTISDKLSLKYVKEIFI